MEVDKHIDIKHARRARVIALGLCMCVRACVRACVYVCASVCVCVCVCGCRAFCPQIHVHLFLTTTAGVDMFSGRMLRR